VAVARRGNVMLLLWTGEPTVQALDWVDEKVAAEAASIERGVALQIIDPRAGPPNAAARARIQAMYRRELRNGRRLVTAPLGDSLRHSVMRALVRGMALVAGRSAHVSVASTLEDAHAAALEHAVGVTAEELSAVVGEMYEALGVAPDGIAAQRAALTPPDSDAAREPSGRTG
jgi:hypothetical protein